MRILGLDFGLKNIGLAYTEGELVEPLGLLKFTGEKKLFQQLDRICTQNKIDLIVIGLPDGELRAKVKKFAKNIEQKIGLSVDFQDETLTSKEAIKLMVESGKPQKKRKQQEHIIAACLILQSYLDQKKINVLR